MALKEKLSESVPNQKQILYDNKPNRTHTHTVESTLSILKPVEISNCNMWRGLTGTDGMKKGQKNREMI